MTDTATVVNDYIAAWNEGDAERRREIVARAFADDATYVDPLARGIGPSAISDMIGGVQQQFPGTEFVLAGEPDAHNDRVRFTWHLRPADGGDVMAVGIDFATVAEDGRLRDVTGFLEPAAA